MVHGAWRMAHDASHMARGAWRMAHHAWRVARGAWCVAHDAWRVARGAWRVAWQAMKMTLNQLLVEMDGFQQNAGVIVLAATNFPESLDRALVRPGRFDTRVIVPLPDVRGRKQILDLYSKPVPLDDAVDLETIARATPGFSGADLSNLMNVAALRASHDDKKKVDMIDLEYACDKIRMGAERKSQVRSERH